MTAVNWALGEALRVREGAEWRTFRVSGRTDDGLNLVEEASKRACWKSEAELRGLWKARELRRERAPTDALKEAAKRLLSRSLCSMSEAERAHVRWLAPYLLAFLRRGGARHASRRELEALIAEVAAERGHEKRPHWRTVSDHLRAMKGGRADGRWLVPRVSARGNRTPRFGRFEGEIDRALRELVLVPNRAPMEDVLARLRAELEAFNDRVPADERVKCALSRRTLERRVAAMAEDEKVAAWQGKQAARRKCVPVGRAPKSARPLQHVEIDHTVLDVLVVHPETGKVLGRPVITVAIDRYSRMVVGLHIGFEEPSYRTVMLCLRAAMLPKDDLLRKHGLPLDSYPCHGVIETIVVDNGREFHSADLDDATNQLLIDVQYCRAGTPWDKGVVERWFGRLNQQVIHRLPGTTKSNPAAKGEYDAEREACLTVADVRRIVTRWVVEVYSVEVHDGIGDAPIRRWREGVEESPVSLPPEAEDLDVLLLPAKPCRLHREGIRLHGRLYGEHERLRALLNDPARPDECMVKYDPDDLGWAFLLDWQEERFIPLRCADKDADGMTLREHEAAAERVRREIRDYEAITAPRLQEARRRIARDLGEIAAKGKLRGRKAARLVGGDPDAPARRRAKAPNPPMPASPSARNPVRAAPPVPPAAADDGEDLGISVDIIG